MRPRVTELDHKSRIRRRRRLCPPCAIGRHAPGTHGPIGCIALVEPSPPYDFACLCPETRGQVAVQLDAPAWSGGLVP